MAASRHAVEAGAVPFYEYSASGHLGRLSFAAPAGTQTWSRGAPLFYAWPEPAEGLIPVYEYERRFEDNRPGLPTIEFPEGEPSQNSLTVYRYSTDSALGGDWTGLGVAFFAPRANARSAQPVFRSIVPLNSTGSRTPGVRDRYSFDAPAGPGGETAFWAYPSEDSSGDYDGPPPPPATPIERHDSSPVGATPGEFAVSPAGSATYTIPIEVPPGTRGMQPTLALSYDSGRGNGVVGMGWALSGLSAITRCPQTHAQDGAVRPVALDGGDRFCLDGQRLQLKAGRYGEPGAVYRTERETWLNVTSQGQCGLGPCSFAATNKLGQTLEFGTSEDSRIEAFSPVQSGRGGSVMVWALRRVEDRYGNALDVRYWESNGEFVPLAIDYTFNVRVDLASRLPAHRQVRFVYGTRPDQRFGVGGGAEQRMTRRLEAIETLVDQTRVKAYQLAYDNDGAARRSRLSSVTECDGKGVCLAPTTFSWSDGKRLPRATYPRSDYLSFWSSSNQSKKWGDANHVRTLADVNGDGKPDLVGFGVDGTWVSLANGSGFGAPARWTGDYASESGWRGYNFRSLADVNGDGKADIVAVRLGHLHVSLSTGSAFGAATKKSNEQIWRSKHSLHVGDVNGDGRPDIVGFHYNGVRVWVANRHGEYPDTRNSLFIRDFGTEQGWNADDHVRMVADVNGDGRSDIVGIDDDNTWVSLSEGNKFGAKKRWHRGFARNDGWNVEDHPRMLADVNGDGLPDMVGFKNDWVKVRLSDGRSFENGNWDVRGMGANDGWEVGEEHRLLADINGDGRSDLVGFGPVGVRVRYAEDRGFGDETRLMSNLGSNYGWRQKYHPRMVGDVNGDGQLDIVAIGVDGVALSLSDPSRAFPDRIVRIDNGLGAFREVDYGPLTDPDLYEPDTDAESQDSFVALSPAPMYAVAMHVEGDGSGNRHAYGYSYAGGRVDRHGRGFLGFGETVTTDIATAVETRTTYRQDFPFIGLVENTLVSADHGDRPLREAETQYESVDVGNRAKVVQVSSQAVHQYGASGAIAQSTETRFDYDNFGNVVLSEDRAGDTPPVFTCRDYQNDEGNWEIGVLVAEKVSDEEGCVTYLRRTEYEYDSRGGLQTIKGWDDQRAAFATVSFQRDPVGNVIRRTDPLGNFVETTYDDRYKTFPVSTVVSVQAQGGGARQLQSFRRFDPAFGVEIASVAPSGMAVRAEHDGFGRVVRTFGSGPEGDPVLMTTIEFAQRGAEESGFVTMTRQRADWSASDTASWPWTETHHDGLGRAVLIRSQGGDNGDRVVQTRRHFDGLGRVMGQTMPAFEDDDEPSTVSYVYDEQGRVSWVRYPDGRLVTNEYDVAAGSVSTFSPSPTGSGRVRTESQADARGRVVAQINADGSRTTFDYDALGQLTRTTDPLGAVVELSYDSLGRVVTETSPERGSRAFEYDLAGNMTAQVDAKGQRIEWSYDSLGRVVGKRLFASGDHDAPVDWVRYRYDGGDLAARGRLSSVAWTASEGDGAPARQFEKSYRYNRQGLPRTSRLTYDDGATYEFEFDYDALGRPTTLTFPDGTASHRAYAAGGGLKELSFDDGSGPALVAAYGARTAAGQFELVNYGNNVTSEFSYNELGLVTKSSTYSSVGDLLLDHRYVYNRGGKLAEIGDTVTPSAAQSFDFDGRGRMVVARRHGQASRYEYDAGGNITRLGERVFTMGRPGKPYQPVAATAPRENFAYDDNGNLSERVSNALRTRYVYDVENRLREVRMALPDDVLVPPRPGLPRPRAKEHRRLRLTYDAQGNRIEKLDRDGTRVRYVGPGYEVMQLSSGEELHTKTLVGAEGAVATITTAGHRPAPLQPEAKQAGLGPLVPGANGAGNPVVGMRYHHRHHLRTTALVTDDSGAVISRFEYEPYGALDAARSRGTDDVRAKFTGKELDAASDLYYFGARYYDPATGRFLSPDPAWQYDNPYAYGPGDPTGGIDPDGRWFWLPMVAVASISAYASAATVLDNMNPAEWDWSSGKTWGALVGGAAVGVVGFGAGSAIAGSALSAVSKLGALSVVSGAEEAAISLMAGNRGLDVLQDFAIGMTIGAVAGRAGEAFAPQIRAAGTRMQNALTSLRAQLRGAGERLGEGVRRLREANCFEAGTLVHTVDGKKPIEMLQPGDLVLSRDEETGEEAYRKVARVFVTHDVQLYELVVEHADGETEVIRTTGKHPFWVRQGGWKHAEALQPGDQLLGPGGAMLRVSSGTWLPKTTTVYNFEVEEFHTYFVGERGVWVHNLCAWGAALNAARNETSSSGMVAALHVPSNGKTYIGKSGGPVPDNLRDELQDALDRAATRPGVRPGTHGKCGEVKCIQQALKDGVAVEDLAGASSAAVKLRRPSNKDYLREATGCNSCQGLFEEFGITDEVLELQNW